MTDASVTPRLDLIRHMPNEDSLVTARYVRDQAFEVIGSPEDWTNADRQTELAVTLDTDTWLALLTAAGVGVESEVSEGYGGSALAFAFAVSDLAAQMAAAHAPADSLSA